MWVEGCYFLGWCFFRATRLSCIALTERISRLVTWCRPTILSFAKHGAMHCTCLSLVSRCPQEEGRQWFPCAFSDMLLFLCIFRQIMLLFMTDYSSVCGRYCSRWISKGLLQTEVPAASTGFTTSNLHAWFFSWSFWLRVRQVSPPSTLLLSAQRKQPHSCSSLPGIKIWPQIPMHHYAANTHTCVNSWAPSHQTNSSMQKCPSTTTYKYHFPNTPGGCRSLPYGTPRAGSALMLTTKTG